MSTILRTVTYQMHVKNEDGITQMKKMTRATADTDQTLKELNSQLGDNVTVTLAAAKTVKEYERDARAIITQTNRQVKAFEKQSKELQHLINLTDKEGEEQAVLNAQYRLGANATEEQREEIARLARQYYILNEAQNKQQSSLRNARGVMQNFGWQMQDTIVQLQMGTSAFVVLSQQGSQMAAAFGPGGAVLGAVIALAGVVAGSLAPSLFDAGNESEKLEETFNSLSEIFDITNNQIEGLNDEFVELYRTDQQLAELKLSKALIDLNDSVELVKGELTTTFNDLADNTFWDNFFGIDNLKQGLREVAQVQAGEEVTAQFERLAEQFNITTEEAEGLLKAKQEYEKTSDISALLSSVTELYNEYGMANTSVTEFALAVTMADRRLKLIKDTLSNDVNPTLSDTSDTIYDAIDAWTDKTIALGQNARQQAIYTGLLELGSDAQEDEIEQLVRSINLYYDRADAIDAAEQAERDREAAARKRKKQNEEEARELEKLERALDRVINKSGDWNKFTNQYTDGLDVIDQALKAGIIGSLEEATELSDDLFDAFFDNISDMFDDSENASEMFASNMQNLFAALESGNVDNILLYTQALQGQLATISQVGSMMTDTFNTIFNGTEQVEAAVEEMNGIQKAMFFITQSIAAAEAIINGISLGSKLAAMFPLAAPEMLAVGASIGGAQAGAIMGTTFAGMFDKGGYIPSGQTGIVSEYRDELVNGVLVKGPASVTGGAETSRIMDGGMGGTNMYVDVQNYGSGTVTTEKVSEDRVRLIIREEMATGGDDMVSSALNKPGSKTQKAVTGNFNTSKRYS